MALESFSPTFNILPTLRKLITKPQVDNDGTCIDFVLRKSANIFFLGSNSWPKGILHLKTKEEVFSRFHEFRTQRENLTRK